MSDKKEAEQAKAPTPRDIFEGIKGRPPKNKIESWMSGSPLTRAKSLRRLNPPSTTRWGEGGHNGVFPAPLLGI